MEVTGARVLSIQSHVVRGYVGNKCSVFTLQLLGFDVDPVNSVQFSNHTGYATFKGTVLQGGELTSLVEGLEANGLLGGYTHMLTGYIGSPSFLHAVIGVFRKLKRANSEMLFICDPVLGDEGKLYVPVENVEIYRQEVLPLATMVTPNQFEAEVLSGVTIRTEEDAVHACMVLHARGPDTVVITSSRVNGGDDRDDIVLIASTRRRTRSAVATAAGVTTGTGTTPRTRASADVGGETRSSPPTAPSPPSRHAAATTTMTTGEAEIGGGGFAAGGDSGGGGGVGVAPNPHASAVGASAGGDAGAGGVHGTGGIDAGAGGEGAGGVEAGGGGREREGTEGAGAGAGVSARAERRRVGGGREGGDDGFDVYRMTFPRLPQHFTGTGDLAAALLLAWTHRLPGDLAGALEKVAGTMQAVLTRTHAQGSGELLLVQSKNDIERPPLELRAMPIHL